MVEARSKAIHISRPFPETIASYVVEYFRKYTETYAEPNQEALSVVEVTVKDTVYHLVVPMKIHSGQGGKL